MARSEEIVNNIGYKMTRAALEYIEKHEFADAMDAFEAGAEWADKTMIEKACEWLKEHYAPAGFVDGIFRKAMEG